MQEVKVSLEVQMEVVGVSFVRRVESAFRVQLEDSEARDVHALPLGDGLADLERDGGGVEGALLLPMIQIGVWDELEDLPSKGHLLVGVVGRDHLGDKYLERCELLKEGRLDRELRGGFRTVGDADEDWTPVELGGPGEVDALSVCWFEL